jgi:hypothetical protein
MIRTLIKTFNILFIISTGFAVAFLCAYFFLGGEETYQRLLEDQPISFLKRMLGGIIIGLIAAIAIVTINYIIRRVTKLEKAISLRKLFWLTVTISGGASIIGTAIFFSH